LFSFPICCIYWKIDENTTNEKVVWIVTALFAGLQLGVYTASCQQMSVLHKLYGTPAPKSTSKPHRAGQQTTLEISLSTQKRSMGHTARKSPFIYCGEGAMLAPVLWVLLSLAHFEFSIQRWYKMIPIQGNMPVLLTHTLLCILGKRNKT